MYTFGGPKYVVNLSIVGFCFICVCLSVCLCTPHMQVPIWIDQNCFDLYFTTHFPVCPACFHPVAIWGVSPNPALYVSCPEPVLSYKGPVFICRIEPSVWLPSGEEPTIQYSFFGFLVWPVCWVVAIYFRNQRVWNVDYQVPHYLSTSFLETHGHTLGKHS